MIDENFVRGGVDVEGENSFPWITRITSKGITFVEELVTKSEQNIPQIFDKLKDAHVLQDKMMILILHCMDLDEIPLDMIKIAQDLF